MFSRWLMIGSGLMVLGFILVGLSTTTQTFPILRVVGFQFVFVSFVVFFAYFLFFISRTSGLEDKRYQRLEDEIRAAAIVQPQLRLINIVEAMYTYNPSGFSIMGTIPLGSYDVKDPDKRIVGHVRRRILCAQCGGELTTLRHCPSCGASAILSLRIHLDYVFEGEDGVIQGEIKMERGMNSILDAEGQLLATARAARGLQSIDLRGRAFSLLDPSGRVIAEYHGDRLGNDYQLVTPSKKVVARVHMELDSLEYYVYASPESIDLSWC